MSNGVEIREGLPTDREALETLYSAAFPDEDLVPLLRELLNEADNVVSLVARCDGEIVGHIAFTLCRIAGREEIVHLLGPLAVSPKFQRQGIGGALIQEGLNRLTRQSAAQVNVLGDPAYYSRFGFEPDRNVSPPYELPPEWIPAWRSIRLRDGNPYLSGELVVPTPWRKQLLWTS